MACGLLVPWPGIEPTSPGLQGRFLTTGPPGKSRRGWIFLTEEYKMARLPPPSWLQSLDSLGAWTSWAAMLARTEAIYMCVCARTLNNMVLLPGWPCYPHNQVLGQSAEVLNPQPRMGYKAPREPAICLMVGWLSGATFHHGGGSKWRQNRRGTGASLVSQMVKNLPAMQESLVRSLDQEDLLEKGMAAHSSILAWRILWTEEPGSLQSITRLRE